MSKIGYTKYSDSHKGHTSHMCGIFNLNHLKSHFPDGGGNCGGINYKMFNELNASEVNN